MWTVQISTEMLSINIILQIVILTRVSGSNHYTKYFVVPSQRYICSQKINMYIYIIHELITLTIWK